MKPKFCTCQTNECEYDKPSMILPVLLLIFSLFTLGYISYETYAMIGTVYEHVSK